jgi:hypothetical protein
MDAFNDVFHRKAKELGFSVTKGTISGSQYRIRHIASGAIVLGAQFETTAEEVLDFIGALVVQREQPSIQKSHGHLWLTRAGALLCRRWA